MSNICRRRATPKNAQKHQKLASSSEDWNDHSSSDCSMSINAMFHKCLYNLFLNSKRLIELLMSNGKEFQNVWLRKKKDLLRLLMLVVVEAIFDSKTKL